jgi:hypothetical protein
MSNPVRRNGNGRKSAAARPYFLFDVQWWLVATAGMTHVQRSAFVDLCAVAWWSDPPATIPEDDDEQAAIAKVPVEEWVRIRKPVLALTTKGPRGRLTITKLGEQYALMCDEHARNVTAGRAGARARWERTAPDNGHGDNGR